MKTKIKDYTKTKNYENLKFRKLKNQINSYTNITDAVYDYANSIKDNFKTNIKIKRNKFTEKIDYSSQPQTVIFSKAKEEFNKIGQKFFKNNGENIYVSNSDIKESIAKTVRNTEQKKLIVEHIEVFANLDKIITNGIKIASAYETKKRIHNYKWNYYATLIKIGRKYYIVEFDTVIKREDKQKHFRLQRIYELEKVIKKQNVPTGMVD